MAHSYSSQKVWHSARFCECLGIPWMPIYYSHNRAQSGRVIRRPCNARLARLCFYNWCIGSPIRMTKPPVRVRPSTRIPPCFWTRFDISPNRALQYRLYPREVAIQLGRSRRRNRLSEFDWNYPKFVTVVIVISTSFPC